MVRLAELATESDRFFEFLLSSQVRANLEAYGLGEALQERYVSVAKLAAEVTPVLMGSDFTPLEAFFAVACCVFEKIRDVQTRIDKLPLDSHLRVRQNFALACGHRQGIELTGN